MSEAEQAGAPSKEPKIIKRYTNRKLYDTVESRYVTLDEIAAMIKEGTEVRIVDNRTKEDLTSVTLAQIIFEEEKKKNQMPLSVLREIIRHPGESISGFIQKEVSPRVASIREEAESRLDKLLRRDENAPRAEGEPEAPVAPPEDTTAADNAAAAGLSPADLLKASQRAFEEWQRRIDERVKHVVENLTGNLPALGRDMASLTQRLEELEKKLEQAEQQKGPPKQE
ncbi:MULTISPECIES: polyhydroxyalkanoate synthesis regulator DNA-binding domain-containing protein [Myxococcus]|uniref:polyhydroxyalkanoate synthesis regulator DNA-binding domain-containing protein n=1 Tax=Myxococcus TaxID=32 RepID=UPI00112AE315|nr:MULTISPECIES: polyhydroxyalkanoate synthesis regulator DNA-binding domain-containing protein [Myxococcus]QDE85358.1 transcriptional regulator [Myxococcus xanthus]QDE99520.1 transcriptional regulator [Myxococcus xanthus]QDF07237.1 transcriptional regulator [Myxococcus xanthus]WAM24842.1 polyhydroxyalkanoate synthesis regulator DNA-binding domain-containing protein [Myxococcus sp. NMCA1]